MRKLGLFFLLITLTVCVSGQSAGVRKELGVEMEATTSIAEQKICIDESGTDLQGRKTWAVRADWELKIKYTNTGQYPVILDKGSGTVSSQRIWTTEENVNAKNNVSYSTFTHMVFSENPRKENGEIPSKAFVTLQPGATYENKTQTLLLVSEVTKYNLLSTGTQFLTLGIWTQDGTLHKANSIDELRARWKKHGYLWAEGITTQPMSISFPKLEELKPCQ